MGFLTMRFFRSAAALAAACLAVPAAHAAHDADPAPQWLSPDAFAPDHAFAPPPAPGSLEERLDLDRLRALIAATPAARREQADWDGKHEDPSIFNAAMGRDLATMPHTMALLTLVQQDVERVVAIAKHHFRRARPFMVDPALPHCGKGEQALKAYPSGHAAFAWSAAWTLAALAPDHAAAVMARAQDYGLSREICGVHYPSDVEASHGMATAAAQALLTDPRLASQVAAARAEWARP
ncbi:phosphatase PAP2 family protein [Novosphingobium pokkalii]|nr:hypothetical protein GCM10019060_40940 [Novosphingobium pokkalii]